MASKNQFPTETIDLPSGGTLYPKDSPMSSGQIEIKYMTAKEEDILTSQNLIKKGTAIDQLINSLIVTKGVNVDDLILGDKNAVMIAARILAYGSEYNIEFTDPNSGEKIRHIFNLADCPFKQLAEDIDYSKNEFELKLPASKSIIKYKLLTGKEETAIEKEIKGIERTGAQVTPQLTARLRNMIIAVDGEDNRNTVNNFVNNMLSKDSLVLRQEIARMSPDIILKQDVDIGGETVEIDIPLTVEFFWPTS